MVQAGLREYENNQANHWPIASTTKNRRIIRFTLLCLILPFCSALLLWFSFPPFSLWWLSFFALAPLIVSLKLSSNLLFKAASGFAFGSLFSFLMGFWVFDTLIQHYQTSSLGASLFLILALVMPVGWLYSLFAVCSAFIQKQSSFHSCLSVASLWILFDYLKELIPLLIPWGTIGYAVIPWQSFVQVADIVGLYGISFIIVVANCCCLILIQTLWNFRAFRKKSLQFKCIGSVFLITIMILLLLSIPAIYGNYQLEQYHSQSKSILDTKKTKVSLVQGNFNLKDRWSGLGFQNRLKRYLQLSKNKNGHGIRIIVWPETVLNSSERVNRKLFQDITEQLGTDEILVTGGLRKSENSSGLHNSAYAISGKGRVLWYDKQILLPYAEHSPINLHLGSYRQAPDKFEQGKIAPVFKTDGYNLGISICFEILYPYYIRRSVRQGAQLLVNISNDSWFEQSPMPALHLQSAVMRSIETRRFLLRTSNSGISAIVSPTGDVLHQSNLGEQEVVQGTSVPLGTQTLYVRFGDWILIVAAIAVGVSLFRIIFVRF